MRYSVTDAEWNAGLQEVRDSALLTDRLEVIENAVDRNLIPEPLAVVTSQTSPSSFAPAPLLPQRPAATPPPAPVTSNTNVTAGRTILPRPAFRTAAADPALATVQVKQEPGEPSFTIPEHARNTRASPVDVDADAQSAIELDSASSAGEDDDGEYAGARPRAVGKSTGKVRPSLLLLCPVPHRRHRFP